MSFAYWDGNKLKLGFKVGKKWQYKRVPEEIKRIEKSDPDRARAREEARRRDRSPTRCSRRLVWQSGCDASDVSPEVHRRPTHRGFGIGG